MNINQGLPKNIKNTHKSTLIRLLSCITIMIVCVLTFSFTVFAEIELIEPTKGNGTKSNPYQISSAGELYWYANLVNTSELSDSQKLKAHNAVLTKNIVVNKKTITEYSSMVEEWTPIKEFNAVFDGNGHTISGLYYVQDVDNDANPSEEPEPVGLFANTSTKSALIENVSIVNSYFYGDCVGGICGFNYGTIYNCSNSARIKFTFDHEKDQLFSASAGGICGFNKYIVANCNNSGNVTGGVTAGGICGYSGTSSASVYNCYNTGKITVSDTESDVGGIVGIIGGGNIYNCYNVGDVTDGTYCGGIAGYVHYNNYDDISVSIYNCFNYNNNIKYGIVGNDDELSSSGTDILTVNNCYYLNGSDGNFGDYFSESDFADGSVAYRLNDDTSGGTTWYQNIDMGEIDPYPVLDDEHYIVYRNNYTGRYTNIPDSAITGYCGTGTSAKKLTYSINMIANSLTISGKGSMASYYEGNEAPWYKYRNYIHCIIADENVELDDYATYGLDNLETVYCYKDSSVDSYFDDYDVTKKYIVDDDAISIKNIDTTNCTFTVSINTDSFAGTSADAKYLDEVKVIVNNDDTDRTIKNYYADADNDQYINLDVIYYSTPEYDTYIQAEVIAKDSSTDKAVQYYVSKVYTIVGFTTTDWG